MRGDKKGYWYIHSTLSVVLAVFEELLFVALHSNLFVLSVLFPVILMDDAYVNAVLAMFMDPRYQRIVGAGTAFVLTTHSNSICALSLMVSGLSFGLMEIL